MWIYDHRLNETRLCTPSRRVDAKKIDLIVVTIEQWAFKVVLPHVDI